MIATADSLVSVILTLVGEACARLEQRGEGARRLELIFERVDGMRQLVRIGTAKPVCDVRHLVRRLDERLETVDPGLGVEAMHLLLPLVEPLAYAQRTSGLAPDRTGDADLSELIDRLVNRLGARRVYRLRPLQSDVPKRSQPAVSVYAPAGKAAAWTTPWSRPVRLLAHPEPVETMSLLPDHPPRAFNWRRVRHRVLHANGPERIIGEWGRRPGEVAAVRDYWTLENQDGRRFRLFRQRDDVDPATGSLSCFLHSFF